MAVEINARNHKVQPTHLNVHTEVYIYSTTCVSLCLDQLFIYYDNTSVYFEARPFQIHM